MNKDFFAEAMTIFYPAISAVAAGMFFQSKFKNRSKPLEKRDGTAVAFGVGVWM